MSTATIFAKNKATRQAVHDIYYLHKNCFYETKTFDNVHHQPDHI